MPRDKEWSYRKVFDAIKEMPVIHEYDEKETEHCLMKVAEFFTPGWMKIMGL